MTYFFTAFSLGEAAEVLITFLLELAALFHVPDKIPILLQTAYLLTHHHAA
jgi:hypothetical protein